MENYLKNNKINFHDLEKSANPTQLKDLMNEFHEKEKIIKQLKPIVNIGIFEFQLDDLLELVSTAPRTWIDKMNKVIPNVLTAKVKSSIERMSEHLNDLSVNPTDVESFIKLKKAVDECTSKRTRIDEEMDEIGELNIIINNNKEIKLEDFEKRKYDHLTQLRTKYERFLDSMIYFIEQNIKQYRVELMVKIKKYDEMLNKIHDELNEEQINRYNEDTLGPLLFLEDKSLLISRAIENKKIFQQQEIDIEMDENEKSNFENLDLVSYEYELKKNIWKNLHEYQQLTIQWEKMQVMEIKTDSMTERIKAWKHLCIVSTKDLDNSQVAKE